MVKSILITGAAGRIAYSLIPLILSGDIFGHSEFISLRLLDIPDASDKLAGVKVDMIAVIHP